MTTPSKPSPKSAQSSPSLKHLDKGPEAPGLNTHAVQAAASSRQALVLVACVFFLMGFATWLNGSLMPYLGELLSLSVLQASWIVFAFYIAVTVTAMPSAWLIERVGYQHSISVGMLVMLLAGLLFVPAALAQSFSLFLLAQLLMGAGRTLLQTAVNPYVVKVGPEASAAARVSLMGIVNKGAGIVAPLVFSVFIVAGLPVQSEGYSDSERVAMAERLLLPYVGMAAVMAMFMLLLHRLKLPPLPTSVPARIAKSDVRGANANRSDWHTLLARPSLVLGVLSIFVYVALEVIAANTIGHFALSLGVTHYALMTSYTMAGMVLGYALGMVLIPRFFTQQTWLGCSVLAGMVVTTLVIMLDADSTAIAQALDGAVPGMASWLLPEPIPDVVLLLALLGMCNAIVWPAVWPLALSGLGPLTQKGSGLLVMGIAGGAVGPVIWSWLSDQPGMTMQSSYWILLPCYGFIGFYAWRGHRWQQWRKSRG